MNEKRICIRCKSPDIVKHGLTLKGTQRFRCLSCNKTWTIKKEIKEKNKYSQISKISELYLDGRTSRELAKIYPTSPVRINSMIRQFLSSSPNWHDYIDNLLSEKCHKNPKQIYLSGKKFYCSWNNPDFNEMFVAFAIDSMTGFILAYNVCFGESHHIWVELLNNLKERNINTNFFLTNGSEISINAVSQTFPESDIKISYHRNYRDKELACCLSRSSPENKLINDAVRIYFSLNNQNIAHELGLKDENMLLEYLLSIQDEFLEIVKLRLFYRTKLYNDSLPILFKKRFEKFHLLKDDPNPIINSWVAKQMLSKDENGLTRLALFTQDYSKLNFDDFINNNINKPNFRHSKKVQNRLLLEVVARCLELPIFTNECQFDFDKCCLVS